MIAAFIIGIPKMRLAVFILLGSATYVLPDDISCCFANRTGFEQALIVPESAIKDHGKTLCTPQKVSRTRCDTIIGYVFSYYAMAGYQSMGLAIFPEVHLFSFVDKGKHMETTAVLMLIDSNITSWSLNIIGNTTYFAALLISGSSYFHINLKHECIFRRNMVIIQFASMDTSDALFNFMHFCRDYLYNIAQLEMKNLSIVEMPGGLPTYFPTLQVLDLTMNSLTTPPQFPWYNHTRTLPLNLTRYELISHLLGSTQDQLQSSIIMPDNLYKRTYRLDYNPNLNLTDYRFRGCLHVISLVGCHMALLMDNIFSDVTGLQFLDLTNNNIEYLSGNVFMSLTELRVLNISFNKLRNLSTAIFEKQSTLVTLQLSYNLLECVESNIFVNLTNLEYLFLDNNRIVKVHKNAFSLDSRKLKFISLRNNPISDFPYDILYLPNLNTLELQGHNISTLNFCNFFTDNSLNLEIIRVTFLPSFDLPKRKIDMSAGTTNMLSIQPDIPHWKMVYILKYHFILDSNPLHCYCYIAALLRLVETLKQRNKVSGQEHAFSAWTCTEPPNLIGKLLLHLNMTALYCPQYNKTCPEKCKCYMRYKVNTNVVDCRNVNLTEAPVTLPPGKTELFLEGNNIKYFTMTPTQCASLVDLRIQDNNLQTMNPHCLSSMKDLKVFHLNNNLLSSIPKEVQKLVSLDSIQFGNNPLQCDCNSLWLKGWLVRNMDIIKDSGDVKCKNFGDDVGHQIYKVPDEDFICKESHFTRITAVIATTTTVAVLTLLCALLLYIHWQRFKVWLYLHTGLHPFDKPDDDEDTLYDAIQATDDEWVRENVFTPLVDYGYRLIDCKKDFRFGLDQNRNIQDGITKSKRLLVVVTQNSLSDRTVRQAIEQGEEKCKTQKSNFIIPLFHGVSPVKCTDKHLQKYIKSSKIVTTEQRCFIQRLLYYMPKKLTSFVQDETDKEDGHVSDLMEEPNVIYLNNIEHTSQSKVSLRDIAELKCDSESEMSLDSTCSATPSASIETVPSPRASNTGYMSFPDLIIEKPKPGGRILFVWYSEKDFGFMMETVVRPLEKLGHTFILADKSFLPGAAIQENILKAIEKSDRKIIIMSKVSVQDEWLLYTFRFASDRHVSDNGYMMGLIVRADMEEECIADEEIKGYLQHYTSLIEADKWFMEKLKEFVVESNPI